MIFYDYDGQKKKLNNVARSGFWVTIPLNFEQINLYATIKNQTENQIHVQCHVQAVRRCSIHNRCN